MLPAAKNLSQLSKFLKPGTDTAVYDEDDLDYDHFEDDEDEDFADFERAVDELSTPNGPSPRPMVGRNAPCLCGSGKKFKHCCGRP